MNRSRGLERADTSERDKPSIAVLPFPNLSGDPEQEYFTDGVTEDIITELSRVHSLFVIARNSSYTYLVELGRAGLDKLFVNATRVSWAGGATGRAAGDR